MWSINHHDYNYYTHTVVCVCRSFHRDHIQLHSVYSMLRWNSQLFIQLLAHSVIRSVARLKVRENEMCIKLNGTYITG